MFGGRNYSPTELLDLCKVDCPSVENNINVAVARILAIVQAERDPEQLTERLKSYLRAIGKVSIGMALDRLHTVATLGDELQGGLDGVDALTYHLCANACEKAIGDLKAVLDAFELRKD